MPEFAYFCGTEQFQPETLLEHAAQAEAAGFDAVAVSDHFHPWVDDASAAPFVWSWLGAAATRTRRVRLATAVTCPLFRYHPALVAQAAATVDRLAGGRFALGVGSGEGINERPLGWEFPGHKERRQRMGEALQIIRRLLDGEKVDFAGEFYRTHAAKLYSPPPHRVPIWMSAGGSQAAMLAGRLADGLIVSVKAPAEALEQVIDPFRQAAQAAGRPKPMIMAQRWSILARTEDDAWQALAAWRGLRVEGRLEEVDPSILRARADGMDRREIIGKYAWARTLEELVDVYRPLVDVGADIVTIQVTSVDQSATIRRLGEEVLPALRRLAARA
ncbi:MAG TPA: TIGR03557 family F420-dependent LLM class oxidoreductase [bacterium]|nr:TIGR03557 family F420-dependent LLM class oxidoreductase [bacterium]